MPDQPIPLPVLVEDTDGLGQMAADLRAQSRIALDTESNSLHSYRERVCLIQFSTTGRDYVLDPLMFGALDPLGAILADARIEKVLHAAEYDLRSLQRDYGFRMQNMFDTMQAGRILGCKRVGLDSMLQEKLGVVLDKRLQKADWGVRPLSDEKLQYAALDTHYLLQLRDLLTDELQAKGLLELAHEDFRILCAAPLSSEDPVERLWQRISARRDLKPRELAVARELLRWREKLGEDLDRPVFMVLSEEKIINLAKMRPSDVDGLREAGLTKRQLEHWASGILQAIAAGEAAPEAHRRRVQSIPGRTLKRLEKLKAWRRSTALNMDVESDVVLPRTILESIAEDRGTDITMHMAASPWRHQRWGAEIAALLEDNVEQEQL